MWNLIKRRETRRALAVPTRMKYRISNQMRIRGRWSAGSAKVGRDFVTFCVKRNGRVLFFTRLC